MVTKYFLLWQLKEPRIYNKRIPEMLKHYKKGGYQSNFLFLAKVMNNSAVLPFRVLYKPNYFSDDNNKNMDEGASHNTAH